MEHAVEKTKQADVKAGPSRGTEPSLAPAPLHPMLQLQLQVGNQAVQELLRAGVIRAKLSVSQPTDPEEQEADSVADRIMRSAAGHAATACSCPGEDEMCEECRQKQSATIARKSSGTGNSAVSHQAASHTVMGNVLRSPGHPLDSATRAFFEPRFGHDFSNVRVHTDSSAATSARSIDALAYTAGAHLVFNAGQYAPHSTSGAHLLAHELTHVVQQAGHDAAPLRRKPAPAKETQPEYIPENSMRSNIEELEAVALPQFQDAVDKIDERGILAAGDQIQAIWERVEGNYKDVAPLSTVAPPSGGPAEEPKPEDVKRDFEKARREVLKGVTTRMFAGSPVLGRSAEPDYPGTLVPFISTQKAQVAWVAKDTAALIALLKREKLEEADQWQAVGLLRQHLNPWNFAYMQAAVRASGLESKFKSFGKGPLEGYQALRETTAQIWLQGEIGPSDEVGLLALLPAQGKVRLLQPLSPSQVSAEIYGRENLWQALLVPFNPAELSGKGGDEWLMMGTELRVDPSMLVPQYALIFSVAKRAQQQKEEKEGTPHLEASGDPVAVVGNAITYSIHWPTAIWPDVKLQWWVEYDAAAVEAGSVDKTENGPSGLAAAEGPSKSHDTSFKFEPSVVGTHTIHCQLTYGETVEDLSYQQTVITLEQKTQIEKERGYDYGVSSPKDILDQLRKELADTPDTPAYKEKRDDLSKRITDIEQSLREAGKSATRMDPIPATYISSADKPLRLPLRLFVGWDPEYNEADRGYNLKLWDYTLQGQPFTITEQGERIMPTLEALLKTFADKCYYPKGNIIAQISEAHLAFFQIHDERLILPTSGPKLIDEILQLLPPDVLRALSMGFLGLAVVSGLLGQEEVAIPAFEVSIYLGGAAAAEELAEKLEHGQFKFDVSTALQVADLAAALIGLGAEFEVATSVKGVGRVSLTPALSGLGKGVGLAQIGIITGVHTAEIAAAVRSKDKDQVISAILRALGDAALFFIIHKASAGLGAKGLPEGEPEFVPHEQLKAQGADEAAAAYGHDVVVTEDGRVFRCSENCADLIWAFRQILDERPEVLNELKDIAKKPKAQRIPAAKELLQRLEGLQQIRNLSNEELANRIAQARGSKVETELKLERLRREGVDLSADEILEASDINARRSPGGKGVPDPFETGNFAHAMYERLDALVGGARVTSDTLPPNVIKEYTIPDNRLPFDRRPRIDRLDRGGETIYEIKPTTEKAKGDAQAKTYAELMDRFDPLPGGRKWKYKTITYDEVRVTDFLKQKGVLQKKNGDPNTKPGSAALAGVHEVLRSPGQRLDAATRAFMEPRFGHDFGNVHVHADAQAAHSAEEIHARAYTVGSDVVFAGGQFSPATTEGQKLLAHELAHVVQQSRRATALQRSPDEQSESPAKTLVNQYLTFVYRDHEGLARELHQYLRKQPPDYTFVRKVFDDIPAKDEDNVAAELVDRLLDSRLDQLATTTEGSALLDVLYDAMITGDVSSFERQQAQRILDAKARRRSQREFASEVESPDVMIFPMRHYGWRFAYATFRAKLLHSGKVSVHYPSSNYQDPMFQKEVSTLPPPRIMMSDEGLILDPDKIVGVKLYDDNKQTVFVPAIRLIDFSNQIQNKIIGTAATAFGLGLTFGMGALAGTGVEVLEASVVAGKASKIALWGARALLWADRVAFGIAAGSMVINDHRDWIIEKFPNAGPDILAAVDKANSMAAYYGWGRLGFDGLRFIGSKVRPAWTRWRAEVAAKNDPTLDPRLLKGVDDELESFLNELAEAEAKAGRPHDAQPQGVSAVDRAGLEASRETPSNLLSGSSMQRELDAVADSPRRPSTMSGYLEEVELPNRHIWRRNREGHWCRFSNGHTCFITNLDVSSVARPRAVGRPEFSPTQRLRHDRIADYIEEHGLDWGDLFESREEVEVFFATYSSTDEALTALEARARRTVDARSSVASSRLKGGGESSGSGFDPFAAPPTGAEIRQAQPGVATGGTNLQPRTGRIFDPTRGRVAAIPGQIAARLRNVQFRSWRDFRETFWQLVSADRALIAGFSAQNQARMARGLAPFVEAGQQVGGGANAVLQLNHIRPLEQGGGLYDLGNIEIVSPLAHQTLGRYE